MRMASPCAACRFATCKFPNLKKKFLGPPPSQILGTPLKFQSCELFRTRLLDCKDKIIAEATSDTFWGVGVAPNIAIFTNPDKFLGCNVLGNLLMNLRDSTKSAKFAQEHTANPPQELITGSKADDLGPPDNNHQSIASTNNISDSVPPQPDGGNPTQPAPPNSS